MNRLLISTIMVSLFLLSGSISATKTANVVLGEYDISFEMDTNDTLNPEYQEPSRMSENGFIYTTYLGVVGNSPENWVSIGMNQFDMDITTILMRNVSDSIEASDDKKLWLNGLVWLTENTTVPWSSLPAWTSTTWLNNQTQILIGGPFPQARLNDILETLSIKENGEEIYRIG